MMLRTPAASWDRTRTEPNLRFFIRTRTELEKNLYTSIFQIKLGKNKTQWRCISRFTLTAHEDWETHMTANSRLTRRLILNNLKPVYVENNNNTTGRRYLRTPESARPITSALLVYRRVLSIIRRRRNNLFLDSDSTNIVVVRAAYGLNFRATRFYCGSGKNYFPSWK